MARRPLQQLLAEKENLIHIIRQKPEGSPSRVKFEARVARLETQIEEARAVIRPRSKR